MGEPATLLIQELEAVKNNERIDLLQLCLSIAMTILKKQTILMNSYEPLLDLLDNYAGIPIQFFTFLLEMHFFDKETQSIIKADFACIRNIRPHDGQ